MKEVSVGILMSDGLILACQRKKSVKYPLKWEFPGGKVEPGETPREALIRELREELSIDADPMPTVFHRQEWNYGDMSYRVFYFLVTDFSGTPVNNTFEVISWVRPTEMLEMDILEGNRETVWKLVAGA